MNSRVRLRVYRTTHLLHWISAAVCFAALMLFTITGITLNHASAIGSTPRVTTREASLPDALRAELAVMNGKMAAAMSEATVYTAEQERPPHY